MPYVLSSPGFVRLQESILHDCLSRYHKVICQRFVSAQGRVLNRLRVDQPQNRTCAAVQTILFQQVAGEGKFCGCARLGVGIGIGVAVGLEVRNQGFPADFKIEASDRLNPMAIATPIPIPKPRAPSILVLVRGRAKLPLAGTADYSCRVSPSTMRPSNR